jgi:hypothetical protein
MGNPLLGRSQVAPEAVVGTALEATHQLNGKLRPRFTPELEEREENVADFWGSNTYDFLSYSSEWTYEGRAVTQELPFFLASSIRGDVTPSTPSGSVKLWTFTFPGSTIPALKSLCCYGGDNTQALRCAGMFTRRWSIEGRDTAAWVLSADLLGRETVYSGEVFADPALTTITNKTVKNKLTRVYIDDTGAGIGGTQKTLTVYGFRFEFNSGIGPDHTMDGQLDMNDILRGRPSATLDITAKWNANMVAEFGKYKGSSFIPQRRFVRIYNEGDTISTTYEHSVQIDGAYIITSFEPLAEDRDGATIARVQMTMTRDDTWGKAGEIQVQNTLTAAELPVA